MQTSTTRLYDLVSGVVEWLIAKESLTEGRLAVAYNSLRRAIRADPENYAALADLSETCLRLGRLVEANELAERAVQLSDSPIALRARVLALVCIGDEDGAARFFLRMPIGLDPEWREHFAKLFDQPVGVDMEEKRHDVVVYERWPLVHVPRAGREGEDNKSEESI